MFKRLFPALLLGLMAAPAWSQTEAPPANVDTPQVAPSQILVVGQRPGPGLWKISKGDHVLWVFGTYAPLPKGMEWRSRQVETIVAQSQAYMTPPSAGIGFFRAITVLPFLVGAKKNPDGARLRDVLPADVYARWLPLKQKYIGADEDIERERPVFAAETLFREGMEHAGLTSGAEVRRAIDKIVKKNNIKTIETKIELGVDDPARAVRDFKKSSLDDVACFSRTLDRLEIDIDALRVNANAWAKGDIAAIEKLNYADREGACHAAWTDGAFSKSRPGFQSMKARMQEAWLAAAEKSLAANKSTFAILQLKDILDPKGYVAALQAKGYVVEKPE